MGGRVAQKFQIWLIGQQRPSSQIQRIQPADRFFLRSKSKFCRFAKADNIMHCERSCADTRLLLTAMQKCRNRRQPIIVSMEVCSPYTLGPVELMGREGKKVNRNFCHVNGQFS